MTIWLNELMKLNTSSNHTTLLTNLIQNTRAFLGTNCYHKTKYSCSVTVPKSFMPNFAQ